MDWKHFAFYILEHTRKGVDESGAFDCILVDAKFFLAPYSYNYCELYADTVHTKKIDFLALLDSVSRAQKSIFFVCTVSAYNSQ